MIGTLQIRRTYDPSYWDAAIIAAARAVGCREVLSEDMSHGREIASTHIYHVASGTPVAAILRPARTPKGSEVRTVIKHVGTSIYSDFERRGAGAVCKFRFFMGSDAPVLAASALRLFSNAAFANIAPSRCPHSIRQTPAKAFQFEQCREWLTPRSAAAGGRARCVRGDALSEAHPTDRFAAAR